MTMAKEGSVAPKERVNIVYRPAVGDAQQEVELPLRLLVLGDFTQAQDERPLENREPVSVDKNNFQEVLKAQKLALDFQVPNKLGGEPDLALKLKFTHMKDFEPDQIVRQIPEMAKLMELRDALKALKGPLGNVPAFRKRLQELVTDGSVREKLLKELGLDKEAK
jgi:type VI secretion system protein ImpB